MPSDSNANAQASALPPGFVSARIVERQSLTPHIEQFRLRLKGRTQLLAEAGSHIELLLDLGSGDEVRHYSICAVEANEISIAVLLEPGGRGGSQWLHEEAIVGTELLVRGPRNTFPFEATDSIYFVAGGIGITPVLSMIAEAEHQNANWQLLYLGHERELMAFTDELDDYGDRVTLWASQERGRADLHEAIRALPHDTTVYGCGPEVMQQALRTASAVTGHIVVIEDFNAGKSATAAATLPAEDRSSLPFTVELTDGSEVDVAANESILDALNQAGFRALSSCKRGTCGTCETPIIEGTADHRDSVLSEEERAANESMMICVSRACGPRIVLDFS